MSPVERMFKIIDERGMTIQSLCDILGVSSSVLANWKKRSDYPPSKYVVTICEFLHVSVDFLFTGKQSDLSLSKNENKLVDIMKCVSNSDEQLMLIGAADNYAKTLPSYIPSTKNGYDEGADTQQRFSKTS